MEKLKDYVSVKMKSWKKNPKQTNAKYFCANISTPPFYLDLWGKKFIYIYIYILYIDIYTYRYRYGYRHISTLKTLNTQSPSTPYCKYLLINLCFLLICGSLFSQV